MKIVFYTCATGPEDGFIDDISEITPDGLECYFLHDKHLEPEAVEGKGWKYINLDKVDECPTNFGTKQRFGKLLPHRHFPDADRTIYLDNKWHLTRAAFEAFDSYKPRNNAVPRPARYRQDFVRVHKV